MPQEPQQSYSNQATWKATFVGILVLVATILCSAVLHFRAMHALQTEVQDKLLRAAMTIAGQIDGDLHRTFTDPKQENTPEYERALKPLHDALYWKVDGKPTRNDYRFVYTCVLVGDDIRFVLDPTSSKIGPNGIDEKSHIMQAYPDASSGLTTALRTGKAQADREPYKDEWGTFVSGYAPFYDSAGKMVGAVGVDWYAETYAGRLAGIRQAWYTQIVLCLLAGFVSGLGTGVAMVRRERAESARRHALEEAERNRARWRIMVETLPKPAAHVQHDELWVNEPFTRTLGWSVTEMDTREKCLANLFGEQAGEMRAVMEAERLAPTHTAREFQVRHRDGRMRWVEAICHTYEPGEVWLLEDITERKEYQTHLIEAREQAEAAAKAKGAFLATVSHEIRTPMNGVIGMTNLILETALDARQREMAETIRSSGEALIVVINDILDFSKIESGGMELENAPFDLRACIEDCLHLFAGQAAEKNLHLVYDLPTTAPSMMRGDANRVRQVLCNLIGNAVKFTEAGEVAVRVRVPEPAPKLEAAFELAIDVVDTGIGIPADRLDRLFKSFSQVDSSMSRKYGGTGLGLAISKRLAELMGGTVTVSSELGHGSTFSFTLKTQGEPAEASTLFAARTSLQGVRVLLVESHVATAAFVHSYLQMWGMDCTVAPDASQALRQIYELAPPALVLTAMQLPGMDGLDLCRAIESLKEPRPRCILLSSVLREDILVEARALGVAQVLRKPVRPAALLQAIESTLAVATENAEGSKPQPAGEAKLASQRPFKILVAEDNAVNRTVAYHTFARLGYEVDFAEDGEKAVAAARVTPYDVIFMDVQMPNMTGYEATQRIRAFPPGSSRPWIVALTASVLESDREMCRKYGMDDFLSKPMRFADLDRILRAVPTTARG